MQTLAEYLGVPQDGKPATNPLEEIADAKEFGLAVLNSLEFRQYILLGLRMGDLPGFAGILKFWLEHAVGKTPDRVEHTGKDGKPIETITEVRRVIIKASDRLPEDDEQQPERYTTH